MALGYLKVGAPKPEARHWYQKSFLGNYFLSNLVLLASGCFLEHWGDGCRPHVQKCKPWAGVLGKQVTVMVCAQQPEASAEALNTHKKPAQMDSSVHSKPPFLGHKTGRLGWAVYHNSKPDFQLARVEMPGSHVLKRGWRVVVHLC